MLSFMICNFNQIIKVLGLNVPETMKPSFNNIIHMNMKKMGIKGFKVGTPHNMHDQMGGTYYRRSSHEQTAKSFQAESMTIHMPRR